MKIVSVVGSKKENSFTERLLNGILKELQNFNNNYEVEKISFRKYTLLDCIGCERCFKEGVCPLDVKDDFGYVKKILEDADIILFGSPVYLDHVSGTMKTFFDRLAYKTHQMKLAGKVGFTLTTTSYSGGDIVRDYLNLIQTHLGINNLGNYIYTTIEKDERLFIKKTFQSIRHELELNKTLQSSRLEDLYKEYKVSYESNGYGYKFERKYWSQDWIKDSRSFYEYSNNNRKQMNLKEFEYIVDNNKILNFTEEEIPVTIEQKNKVIQVIENYFNVYLIGKLAPEFYLDFLLVLVESYPLLKDKAKWEEIGYRICSDIKDEIEEKGISEYFLGMIGGFGYKAYLVNCYSNATGNLIGFSKSLNELLLDYAYNKAKKYMELNKITNMKDYDLVYGLSGNLYYLLDFEWDCDQKEKIEKVIEYLIGLTKTHKYKGNEVINFHITREEQFRDDEKENYPDGNLNFGISHGMLGPLIALTKALKLGYKTTGINYAINKLFLMYEVYKTYHDEIPIWPTQLTYKAYATKEFTEYNIRELRASWCYGNVGIVRGLYKASEYMNDSAKMKLYSNELIKIINQELENYHLNIPVLCHGYASILAIQFAMYKSIQNNELLKKKDQNLNMILLECLAKDEPDNIDNYLNNVFYEDMSLLQGAAGIVLSLLSIFKDNMYYEKIIMID